MDGGFIVLVGCLEMGGTEVGYGLWLKCWGFFLYSRRELGLSLVLSLGVCEVVTHGDCLYG